MKTSRFTTTTLMATVALAGTMLLAAAVAPASQDDKNKAAQDAPQLPFSPGATQEMKDMAWQVGTWQIDAEFVGPDGTTSEMETTSTITALLDGCFLKEELSWDWGGAEMKLNGFRSYDQFRRVYRFVWLDSMMGLADIYEGTSTNGVLTADNTRCDTSFPSIFGGLAHGRMAIEKTSEDRFVITWSFSSDDGETWGEAGEMVYTRTS